MATIVCVGACYLDTILTVSRYPAEDEKLRASSLIKRRGGNCPNTLEVLQQLGEDDDNAHLIFLGTLPSRTSPATKLITDSLPGIDLRHCIYREESQEASSSYIIKSEAADSRTIVNYNELKEMSVDEFVEAAKRIANGVATGAQFWFHFEGRIAPTCLACMKYIHEHYPQATVSVEIEKPGRPGLEDLAAEADVVFFSRSYAEDLGFKTSKTFLENQGEKLKSRRSDSPLTYNPEFSPNVRLMEDVSPILFCTWGAQGSRAYHSGIIEHAKPLTTDVKVVDPVGAGDSFIAGVLFALAAHRGNTVSKALRLGIIVAEAKVQREGFQGLGQGEQASTTRWLA